MADVCQESAQLGLVVGCGKRCTQTFALFALSLVQELFFSVFGLLVALNIMSGDLKLCRECVIVEFL